MTLRVTFVQSAYCYCHESVIMVIEVNKEVNKGVNKEVNSEVNEEVNSEVDNAQQVHTPVSFMKRV